MRKIHDVASELGGELIAGVIGWLACMLLLAGSYQLGGWLASHIGEGEHRDAFGILSAMAFIWIYERRQADERWAELREMIERIASR
ncbi:MAG TPA: hypothetical protein VN222_06825 [Novosphingobium sp.]|nr:hypothetical protein [Novosphingobium sp.]